MPIELIPIGVVKNSINSLNRTDITKVISEIRVYKKYKQALDSIEDFSDIIIVYWMDQLFHYERSVLQVHPQGRKDIGFSIYRTHESALKQYLRYKACLQHRWQYRRKILWMPYPFRQYS